MPIISAYAVPHPPLIVPGVGRGQELGISDTVASYEEVSRRIRDHAPDTIVVTSPHAPLYRDGFFVSSGHTSRGSMAQFTAPQESLEVNNDMEFQKFLAERIIGTGIPAVGSREFVEELDHATYVPLHFLKDILPHVRLVRVGLSGLPDGPHFEVGRQIAEVAEELDRKVVLIASGDLSHKLKEDGPYGFDPAGPFFDQKISEIFEHGNLSELFELDEQMCDDAAECGLRSFQIMAGALDGAPFDSDLLSYEGPFGVGYGVATFELKGPSEGTAPSETSISQNDPADPMVALARETVETYTRSGKAPSLSENLPSELLNTRAGAFVSLHENGELRGCIGTIEPVQSCLAEEIISNAISACSRDPRFMPVRPEELDHLEYSVDVLSPAEPIDSIEQLNPKQYGVIVTKGGRRGLLLPDLEGVDTAEQQVAISKQKAGIPLDDNDVQLERFEVIRHTRGGEPKISK